MAGMNPEIDNYLAVGCGRCPFGGTPDCKVHNWQEELKLLRQIVLDCGLKEELKWSVPCYTVDGANILILSAFKDYVALSFFKGALIKDMDHILYQQTKNSHATRLIRFSAPEQVIERQDDVRACINQAIEIEKSGLKVPPKDLSEFDFPDELQEKFEDDPSFESAFEALTPGRQKGYLLHFSGAKQSKTRVSRIEKSMAKIFAGKGFNER